LARGYSNSYVSPKYYYNEISLQPATLDSDQGITQAFIAYDIYLYFNATQPQAPPIAGSTTQEESSLTMNPERQTAMMYKDMATLTIAEYFNHSLWGRGFDMGKEVGCPEGFWKVRMRYGQPFTDRLAAFLLRALGDEPYKDASQQFEEYFHERLQMADSVIDNESAKLPAIEAILQECKWPKIQ
jgi:hypothetical protein